MFSWMFKSVENDSLLDHTGFRYTTINLEAILNSVIHGCSLRVSWSAYANHQRAWGHALPQEIYFVGARKCHFSRLPRYFKYQKAYVVRVYQINIYSISQD